VVRARLRLAAHGAGVGAGDRRDRGCLYCPGDIGSLFFQVLFSRLFKIDTDTTIIASAAFIFSAPFVPTVANALRNKEIILSGITIGIIGYATGNFLGITLAYFLK